MKIFSWIAKLLIADTKEIKAVARYKRYKPRFLRTMTEAEILANISRCRYEKLYFDAAIKKFRDKEKLEYIN
jgi:hypothetical protein